MVTNLIVCRTGAVGNVGVVSGVQVEATAGSVHENRAHGAVLRGVHRRIGVNGPAVGGDHEPNAAPVLSVGVAGFFVSGEIVQRPAVISDLFGAVGAGSGTDSVFGQTITRHWVFDGNQRRPG